MSQVRTDEVKTDEVLKDVTIGDIIDVLLCGQKKSRNTKRTKQMEMTIPSWNYLNKQEFMKAMTAAGFGTWATIDFPIKSEHRQRLVVNFPPKRAS